MAARIMTEKAAHDKYWELSNELRKLYVETIPRLEAKREQALQELERARGTR